MKTIHKILNAIIVTVYVTIWACVAMFGNLTLTDEIMWHILMTVISLFTVYMSVYKLEPDVLILATYLGDIYCLYASNPKKADVKHKESTDGNPGLLESGFAIIFPPVLAKGYKFPRTLITVPFRSMGAVTKEDSKDQRLTAVTVFLAFQFRFAPHLNAMRDFARTIPVLRDHATDLTVQHELKFFSGISAEGTVKVVKKWAPCAAKILQKELQSTIDEAVSRAIANATLKEALLDKKKLETEILKQFTKTVLVQARLLQINDATGAGETGDACQLFDFNIAAVVPTDASTMLAISAETTAIYTANARKAEAEGEAGYLQKIADTVNSPAGQRALAAETLKKLPAGTTLVATPGVLDAVVAQMLSNQQPKPGNPPTT